MTRTLRRRIAVLLLLVAAPVAAVSQTPRIELSDQQSGTDALLIGVSPVNDAVVWLSGTGGTVLRTTDAGETWNLMVVPGADSLQFRDVHGVDAETAYVMSAGEGDASRIYKTTDGGRIWTLQFVNDGPGGFFDCMDFWDADHGVAFSDSYAGSFILIETTDGGNHWNRIQPTVLPEASDGEGSFASSGTCLRVLDDSTVAVGTGAGASARFLRSTDRGRSWQAYETPITGGTSTSGISSLAFVDATYGYAFGLELSGSDKPIRNLARTADGGETWTPMPGPQLPDVYGAAVLPGSGGRGLVAVGPKGIDYSSDGGETWISLSKLDYWGLGFGSPDIGWATGPEGRVTKLTITTGRR